MTDTETLSFSAVYVKMTFDYMHHRGAYTNTDTLELEMFRVWWPRYTREHKRVHWTAQTGRKSGWHGNWMMINLKDHGQILTVDFNWQGKSARAVKHKFESAKSQTDAPSHFVGNSEKGNDTIELFLKDYKRVSKDMCLMLEEDADCGFCLISC